MVARAPSVGASARAPAATQRYRRGQRVGSVAASATARAAVWRNVSRKPAPGQGRSTLIAGARRNVARAFAAATALWQCPERTGEGGRVRADATSAMGVRTGAAEFRTSRAQASGSQAALGAALRAAAGRQSADAARFAQAPLLTAAGQYQTVAEQAAHWAGERGRAARRDTADAASVRKSAVRKFLLSRSDGGAGAAIYDELVVALGARAMAHTSGMGAAAAAVWGGARTSGASGADEAYLAAVTFGASRFPTYATAVQDVAASAAFGAAREVSAAVAQSDMDLRDLWNPKWWPLARWIKQEI